MVYILLVVVITVAFASILFVLKELQSTRGELADLRHRLEESERNTKQLREIEHTISAGREQQEQELNTLWAEMESLRSEVAGLSQKGWRGLLQSRIPSLDRIRELLQKVAMLDSQLFEQLKANLPCYLFDDDPLTGLLDMARTPFDRISWMDALILPAAARSVGRPELDKVVVELAEALGFEIISPQLDTVYDVELHEPVEQRIAPKARGTILAVKERGYRRNEKVLRKAKVVICA